MKQEKNSEKNLNAGHRKRMRNKFILSKGKGFCPHELLEMLLYYTIPRNDTNKTAHRLMNEFHSLHELFTEGDYESFKSIEGVGEKSAVFLTLVGEIFQNCTYSRRIPRFLRGHREFCRFSLNKLQAEHEKEVLLAICLEDTMQVARDDIIASGSPGTLKLNLHKIAKFVFQSNCTSLVLAHNHPAGEAVPSYQDIAETKLLHEHLKMLEIDLLDHIIIANGEAYSMAEHHDF